MTVLIQIQNLGKNYGDNQLFANANVSIAEGQKIGVIGRNGAGKSTLCRLILNEEEPDAGVVVRHSALRLSYLQQHDSFEPGETVLEFLIRHTGKEAWRCGKIAGSFQLKHELLETPVDQLSGGFQTRVKLAAMLLEDPNVLLLDEPTNYLDLNTLFLLERFLRSFQGGFLIVSHDREFLKRTAHHTLDVDNGELFLFPGEIEAYLEFRDEQSRQQERYNENVATKRKELETFVTRFRAQANKARQAQSKQKQLDKLEFVDTRQAGRRVNIRIPPVEHRKGFALTTSDLKVGYPERTIASGIALSVQRGAKVAVVGDNGQGKTTFLRTIAQDLQALGGTFQWKKDLKIAYYAQHVYKELVESDTILEYLERSSGTAVTRQQVLDLAGSFLFSGDDVHKPIRVLSGGERARVCLARMLLSKSDVLLLDEPTNHLDFETVEGLGRALRSFPGTIFFVSHDRTFVRMLATNIVEVKDGDISLYSGEYEDYLYRLEASIQAEEDANGASTGQEDPAPKVSDNKARYQARKELQATRKKIAKEVSRLEATLGELQTEKQEIVDLFISDSTAYNRERSERLETLTASIEECEATWLERQEALEEITQDLEVFLN